MSFYRVVFSSNFNLQHTIHFQKQWRAIVQLIQALLWVFFSVIISIGQAWLQHNTKHSTDKDPPAQRSLRCFQEKQTICISSKTGNANHEQNSQLKR